MIFLGASSGGLKALQVVLGELPADFLRPIAVVLHRHKDTDDSLPAAFQRYTPLPVHEADDKELFRPGHVYIAPPDYHLLVEPNCFSLSVDDPICYARPSIDVLFESAADIFGPRAIGVILTGASRDGANGAALIQKCGGTVIVQDPATAEFPAMPAAALAVTHTQLVRPLGKIAETLVRLSKSNP